MRGGTDEKLIKYFSEEEGKANKWYLSFFLFINFKSSDFSKGSFSWCFKLGEVNFYYKYRINNMEVGGKRIKPNLSITIPMNEKKAFC